MYLYSRTALSRGVRESVRLAAAAAAFAVEVKGLAELPCLEEVQERADRVRVE